RSLPTITGTGPSATAAGTIARICEATSATWRGRAASSNTIARTTPAGARSKATCAKTATRITRASRFQETPGGNLFSRADTQGGSMKTKLNTLLAGGLVAGALIGTAAPAHADWDWW